jgi:hypothetical protein
MLNLTAIAPQVEQIADYVAAREQFARALAAGTSSLILANCAQPLGHDQKAALEKNLGAPVIEINFQTHFDLSHPLRPQVLDLAQKIVRRLKDLGTSQLDYIVPPAHPAAAHLLAQYLTLADPANPVGLVWLKRDDDRQTFVLGGVE